MRAIQVSKTYGSGSNAKKAVDNVSIELHEGSIYGLIGNNGAGKTTLMKILCGMTEPDHGSVERNSGKIGSLIESPALYNNRSVYDHMMMAGMLVNHVDEKEINEILDTVGLKNVAGRKAGKLSLGMKQRLGLGIALIGDPDVLILDEPMNGLDPEGIRTFRNILMKLKQEGKTILISSHLIDELVKIADVFGIMYSSTLVKEVTTEDIRKMAANRVYICTPEPDAACDVLHKIDLLPTVQYQSAGHLLSQGDTLLAVDTDIAPHILNRMLVDEKIPVSGLWTETIDMERYFIEQMSGGIS